MPPVNSLQPAIAATPMAGVAAPGVVAVPGAAPAAAAVAAPAGINMANQPLFEYLRTTLPKFQDNNGNQFAGDFLGKQSLSTAAMRLQYGLEGFTGIGDRDQNGDGKAVITPQQQQQFFQYYLSGAPGAKVADYYAYLKANGANYNKGDIVKELKAKGLNDLADEAQKAPDKDVNKMNILMKAMDQAAAKGVTLDLKNTVDGTGKNVLNDLAKPDSNKAKEFAQLNADKKMLISGDLSGQNIRMVTDPKLTFDNVQNKTVGNVANLQRTAFTPGAGGIVPVNQIGAPAAAAVAKPGGAPVAGVNSLAPQVGGTPPGAMPDVSAMIQQIYAAIGGMKPQAQAAPTMGGTLPGMLGAGAANPLGSANALGGSPFCDMLEKMMPGAKAMIQGNPVLSSFARMMDQALMGGGAKTASPLAATGLAGNAPVANRVFAGPSSLGSAFGGVPTQPPGVIGGAQPGVTNPLIGAGQPSFGASLPGLATANPLLSAPGIGGSVATPLGGGGGSIFGGGGGGGSILGGGGGGGSILGGGGGGGLAGASLQVAPTNLTGSAFKRNALPA